MVFDAHMHILNGDGSREQLLAGMRSAGVDGGVLISHPPACFRALGGGKTFDERLGELLLWCGNGSRLFPFYWIDPLEPNALEQVSAAAGQGVSGFKIICDRYFPHHPRAIEVCRAIAGTGKPILFHSGILWDGKPSSRYCRPVEFEALMEVEGLRFAMAHVAWPWCDELIAVFGKLLQARRTMGTFNVQMFVDTTPGTPAIYRREVLTKLFTVGYDVGRHVVFGTDSMAGDYQAEPVKALIKSDHAILRDLGLEPDVVAGVFGENLKRFLGTRP